MTTVPHGFDDDAQTRRLLRSRPPRHALDWAGSALGGTVTAARALRGGTASAIHLLTVTSGSEARRVVLRRYVREEALEEPDLPERESCALTFAAQLPVPTPQLLAVDAAGEQAGVPAVLMSWLPGSVRWWPPDTDRWLAGLAALLPAIHAAPLPPPEVIPPFAPYRQASYEPPAWARWPRIWARAAEICHQPIPAGPRVFLHRDFHPGNVLWQRTKVSGVVDWPRASTGPPSADVGHCRANLFGYGAAAVDRFTFLWEGLTGASYDPWADVVTIIGFLGSLRDEVPPPGERDLIEDVLAQGVTALG